MEDSVNLWGAGLIWRKAVCIGRCVCVNIIYIQGSSVYKAEVKAVWVNVITTGLKVPINTVYGCAVQLFNHFMMDWDDCSAMVFGSQSSQWQLILWRCRYKQIRKEIKQERRSMGLSAWHLIKNTIFYQGTKHYRRLSSASKRRVFEPSKCS